MTEFFYTLNTLSVFCLYISPYANIYEHNNAPPCKTGRCSFVEYRAEMGSPVPYLRPRTTGVDL